MCVGAGDGIEFPFPPSSFGTSYCDVQHNIHPLLCACIFLTDIFHYDQLLRESRDGKESCSSSSRQIGCDPLSRKRRLKEAVSHYKTKLMITSSFEHNGRLLENPLLITLMRCTVHTNTLARYTSCSCSWQRWQEITGYQVVE